MVLRFLLSCGRLLKDFCGSDAWLVEVNLYLPVRLLGFWLYCCFLLVQLLKPKGVNKGSVIQYMKWLLYIEFQFFSFFSLHLYCWLAWSEDNLQSTFYLFVWFFSVRIVYSMVKSVFGTMSVSWAMSHALDVLYQSLTVKKTGSFSLCSVPISSWTTGGLSPRTFLRRSFTFVESP